MKVLEMLDAAANMMPLKLRRLLQRLLCRFDLHKRGTKPAEMAKRLTNLDLVNKVDGFPHEAMDPKHYAALMKTLYTLVWEDIEGLVPVGYVPESVLAALQETPVEVRGEMEIDSVNRTVKLFHKLATEPERTALVAKLAETWRKEERFRILKAWRDEPWPIFGRNGELLYSMERATVGLFGCMRYGVHMTAYIRCSDNRSSYPIRVWVPERSRKKSSFPSMFDNTVAGGMMTGEEPFESIIREADEEASLSDPVVRGGAKLTGTIAYVYITDERSGMGDLIYPEVQWIYDLELPADNTVIPTPKDGEVEKFSLHTVEEIQEQLAAGMWKPNCAVVMLDFLVRHGVYTRQNEPNYDTILKKSHRIMPFPGPHKAYESE